MPPVETTVRGPTAPSGAERSNPHSLLDLRSEQQAAGPDPKCGRIENGRLAFRAPEAIDALCLHQTACVFGVSPAQIAASDGNADLAKHRRALRVHAHVTAFSTGVFVPAFPLKAFVYHGNGANRRSIGLEIEGNFNGNPGGPRGEPSEAGIQAARDACTWIVEAAREEGIAIRYVLAHRQFNGARRSDPGWSLWRRVALEHCVAKLGLLTQPDLFSKDGRPIPTTWDATSNAKF